jgi:hypothetical protein
LAQIGLSLVQIRCCVDIVTTEINNKTIENTRKSYFLCENINC